MVKFKLYFDKDAETNWLNEMSRQGYAMTGFCAGFYTFEKCEPGKYIYQVDFGSKFFAIDEDYREFMNDFGVEIVQPWGYWIILRKLAVDGEFKLYTDVDSSIEHYTKILKMFKIVTIIEMICFYIELISALNGFRWGFLFMLIIGALTIALFRTTIRTKRTIIELKARKGECCEPGSQKVSPLLPIGLLINSVYLLLQHALPANTLPDFVGGIFIGLGLVFMITGLYRTRHVFKL